MSDQWPKGTEVWRAKTTPRRRSHPALGTAIAVIMGVVGFLLVWTLLVGLGIWIKWKAAG